MTALLDAAVARVRALPEADQDIFASVLLAALDPTPTQPLDDDTRAAIREGLAQARRGECAADEDIAALLADRTN